MAVRRSAFESVGGFDASLESCEDVDLCRKLREHDWTLVIEPAMHSVHWGDPRTLRAVFLGELWRGRDNIRVSLRPPRTWRTLASAAIPALNLVALAVFLFGLIVRRSTGLSTAALGAGIMLVTGAQRITRMWEQSRLNHPAGLIAVAAAYELGRAVSLITKFGHARRRETGR
jgi:GT2 family glycosyltransferase